jgi:hypothetical protein
MEKAFMLQGAVAIVTDGGSGLENIALAKHILKHCVDINGRNTAC